MIELYKLGISENTLVSMIEIEPMIKELGADEIIDKINILKKINCSNSQIVDIVSSNPNYFNRTNDSVISLIQQLNNYGFNTLNVLLSSNPYILNLEIFEIENYINSRIDDGENLESIIDDLDSNPILFNEM